MVMRVSSSVGACMEGLRRSRELPEADPTGRPGRKCTSASLQSTLQTLTFRICDESDNQKHVQMSTLHSVVLAPKHCSAAASRQQCNISLSCNFRPQRWAHAKDVARHAPHVLRCEKKKFFNLISCPAPAVSRVIRTGLFLALKACCGGVTKQAVRRKHKLERAGVWPLISLS